MENTTEERMENTTETRMGGMDMSDKKMNADLDEAIGFFLEKGADLAEKTEISLEELFIYSNKRRKGNE